jgi:hypothetical protein
VREQLAEPADATGPKRRAKNQGAQPENKQQG